MRKNMLFSGQFIFFVFISIALFLILQIEKVVETFPQLTKEIAAIILQSNDCNLLQAIDAIGQGSRQFEF